MLLTRADNGRDTKATAAPATARDHAASAYLASLSASIASLRAQNPRFEAVTAHAVLRGCHGTCDGPRQVLEPVCFQLYTRQERNRVCVYDSLRGVGDWLGRGAGES